jgi:hypothetical protein
VIGKILCLEDGEVPYQFLPFFDPQDEVRRHRWCRLSGNLDTARLTCAVNY